MLVISVGGNDIALAPSICTVLAMVLLKLALFWTDRWLDEMQLEGFLMASKHVKLRALEDDNPVATTILLSSSSSVFHWLVPLSGQSLLLGLINFKADCSQIETQPCVHACQVQCYAQRLTAVTRPRKVGICMIYNLDERNGE